MNIRQEIGTGIREGVQKGWTGFVWLVKILVPVSFVTLLVEYSGVLGHLDFFLTPLMGFLNLPSMAALPLVVGLLSGIYAAIAAMSVLPLTTEHMTVLAVFLLISHLLIQEGVVQSQSGIRPFKAIISRLTASILTAFAVSRLIGADPASLGNAVTSAAGNTPLVVMLKTWCLTTLVLAAKLLAILVVLLSLLEIMKRLNLVRYLVKPLSPVLRLMGLPPRLATLWLTAAIFGLTYGAAVIVAEVKAGGFTDEELTRLQLSIGINHAMVEDPLLFVAMGINPLWLWLPRLMAAIAAVQVHRLFSWFKMAGV